MATLIPSQEYAPEPDRAEPYQSYVYSSDPAAYASPWCKVHKLSDVITRVPLMPLFSLDADDYDEEVLYDVVDMWDEPHDSD